MVSLQSSLSGLVRDLRRHTQRLKNSFEQRNTAVDSSPTNERWGDDRLVSRSVPTSYEWILTAESGPLAGMRYSVAAPVMLGQAQECDLTLLSSQVSLYPTRLILECYALYVEDMGSGSGTLLNGRPIVGRQPLNHGDVIRVHDSLFRVSSDFYRVASNSNLHQVSTAQLRQGAS